MRFVHYTVKYAQLEFFSSSVEEKLRLLFKVNKKINEINRCIACSVHRNIQRLLRERKKVLISGKKKQVLKCTIEP